MNPTIARLRMRIFRRQCVSWDGETFTIAFPGYAYVPEIQQRAVIPLCFEALIEDLGSKGTAQWHYNRIRIKPEKPLSKEALDSFALAATNVCRAFLNREFWMGIALGAWAEQSRRGDDEEGEEN